MNQTLLFLVGTAVFAVTVCATLYYGYVLFNRSYEADVADHPVAPDLSVSTEAHPVLTSAAPLVAPALP
jgi:hypothetical protein